MCTQSVLGSGTLFRAFSFAELALVGVAKLPSAYHTHAAPPIFSLNSLRDPPQRQPCNLPLALFLDKREKTANPLVMHLSSMLLVNQNTAA
jgi:hypothetical protein